MSHLFETQVFAVELLYTDSNEAHDTMHQYLSYESHKPGRPVVNRLAQTILNEYMNTSHSISELRKVGQISIQWTDRADGTRHTSKPISYRTIRDHLIAQNTFDHASFDLFEMKSEWLDGSIELALQQHFVDPQGRTVSLKLAMPFGDSFPIVPTIDREGVLYNSFQNPLAKRIVDLHHRIVENSHSFHQSDWLYDLITLISNCVSIVDITLNQLFLKAQFDPLPNWTFDLAAVGGRIGRRFDDKIRWVGQISGIPLNDAEVELQSFRILKSIRNHTQHFDPPCFGFTLEDAVEWLDRVSDVGSLLLKIRKRIGCTFNEQLVAMVLLPKIHFDGIVLFDRKRLPQGKTGYASTTWNND